MYSRSRTPWTPDQLKPQPSISVSLAGEEEEEAASCRCRILEDQARRTFDTYSLLIFNISFRSSLLPPAPTPFASVTLCINASRTYFAGTTADDLFPLFDKYGKVVDVFIPRDRRTEESRGSAFVRYKYADEAQKAVDKLDGVALVSDFQFLRSRGFLFALCGKRLDCRSISCSVFLLKGRFMDGREIGVQFAK